MTISQFAWATRRDKIKLTKETDYYLLYCMFKIYSSAKFLKKYVQYVYKIKYNNYCSPLNNATKKTEKQKNISKKQKGTCLLYVVFRQFFVTEILQFPGKQCTISYYLICECVCH